MLFLKKINNFLKAVLVLPACIIQNNLHYLIAYVHLCMHTYVFVLMYDDVDAFFVYKWVYVCILYIMCVCFKVQCASVHIA